MQHFIRAFIIVSLFATLPTRVNADASASAWAQGESVSVSASTNGQTVSREAHDSNGTTISVTSPEQGRVPASVPVVQPAPHSRPSSAPIARSTTITVPSPSSEPTTNEVTSTPGPLAFSFAPIPPPESASPLTTESPSKRFRLTTQQGLLGLLVLTILLIIYRVLRRPRNRF